MANQFKSIFKLFISYLITKTFPNIVIVYVIYIINCILISYLPNLIFSLLGNEEGLSVYELHIAVKDQCFGFGGKDRLVGVAVMQVKDIENQVIINNKVLLKYFSYYQWHHWWRYWFRGIYLEYLLFFIKKYSFLYVCRTFIGDKKFSSLKKRYSENRGVCLMKFSDLLIWHF